MRFGCVGDDVGGAAAADKAYVEGGSPMPSTTGSGKAWMSCNAATSLPLADAKLLKGVVVEKDSLAEEGTAFQDRQIEAGFYFTLDGSYCGGHLQSLPMSDGEAHRALKLLPEETPVRVRYDPANPDQVVTLLEDNAGFPIAIWSG